MLRRLIIVLSLVPFLSGCAIPLLIAMEMRGSGQRISRIDILQAQSEICTRAIARPEEGYEAFQPIPARYSRLSSVGQDSRYARIRRLSTPHSTLIWIPARVADHGKTFEVAKGRFAIGNSGKLATLLLARSESSDQMDLRNAFIGFSGDSSFEIALLISDPADPAYSAERLFQTPDQLLVLPTHSDAHVRLIQLEDLDSKIDHATVMQLVLINSTPYLLAAGETTTSDDPQLSEKLPGGFSLNWPVTLTELRADGSLEPICRYRVHTRTIQYGGL